MTPATVQVFYGILAIAAIAAIVAVAGLRLLAVMSDGARDAYDALAATVEPMAFGLAWVVAFLATSGSLYFSEVPGYVPCTLCWYQRIVRSRPVRKSVVAAKPNSAWARLVSSARRGWPSGLL